LKDTVVPYNEYTGAGTGFGFDDYTPSRSSNANESGLSNS